MTQSKEQASFTPVEGSCSCKEIHYRMNKTPMMIHACHCTCCQRESGSAFAINALVESAEISLTNGVPEYIAIPTSSGKIQRVARCPNCKVALWSHYATAGDSLSFVRVGTLDESAAFPPDIHVFTSTKQPWVIIPDDKPSFAEFYNLPEQWPAHSMTRMKTLQSAHQSQQ
jgi:hypothetical protein